MKVKLLVFTVSLAADLSVARAQLPASLVEYGATDPVPEANDAYQLTYGTGRPDGLNYYFDDANPPGQTFTTGSNPGGYVLSSVYIRTGGGGGQLPAGGQAYTLRLYSVSGGTATLLATYISQPGFVFTQTDWLQWTNIAFGLQPNTQYAYSMQRNTAGWENLANCTGNLYTVGEVAMIPPVGGPIIFGSSHQFDATFDIRLSVATAPFVNPPMIAPGNMIPVGTIVTLSTAPAVGPGPVYYQWRTDGGGGVLTNVPGATGTALAVDTTGFLLGNHHYAVMVTNSTSAVTSIVATLNVYQFGNAVLTDVGATITPGFYDITQQVGGGNGDGLNYYDNNNPPPGQTFTTGTNSQGYYLTCVTLGTGGGSSSGTGTPQGYSLYIYFVEGSTASLMASLTNSSFSFAHGDWLTWSDFAPIVLKPNSVYAYAFQRSSSGWAGMNCSPSGPDVYAGGRLCLVPRGGGTIAFGSSGLSDAVFNIGLTPIGIGPSPYPFVSSIEISPAPIALAGTHLTLTAHASGEEPLRYQWRTDGGSGGALTNIPGSTATNLALNTTGWAPRAYRYDVVLTNRLGAATGAVSTITVLYANTTALLEDIGELDPLPTADIDLVQLVQGGGSPDGLNYYTDSSSPPGQTFLTGGNPGGYTLTSLAVRTGTGGTGELPAGGQPYVLRIYTMSGAAATLYAAYTSQGNFTFTHGDWLRWSGLDVPLNTTAQYAYSFGRVPTGSGWENLSSVSSNRFSGGEVALIPRDGGTAILGGSHNYDATFIIGLARTGFPKISPPSFSSRAVYCWNDVTATAALTGPGPITSYWWETDLSFGSYEMYYWDVLNPLWIQTVNLPRPGSYAWRLVAENGAGRTYGEVGILKVYAPSPPFIEAGGQIAPASATRFEGGGGSVTFSARISGTLPISYQWQVDKGSGYADVVGETNTTLTLTHLQSTNSGYYRLWAGNMFGDTNSAPARLIVHPIPSGPVTVNFQWHSREGGDAGTYSGAGIPGLGTGTYWNQVIGPAAWIPGTYSSASGLADDGTTEVGISWTLVTAGSWSVTTNPSVPLLESYAMAYGTQTFMFTLPNGLYLVVLFSCNGDEAVSAGNSATAFQINGASRVAVPTQHSLFVEGDNYVVFSNVVVTTERLDGTWGVTNSKSFGAVNGAQLRYLGSANPSLTPQFSGNQLMLTWPAAHVGWTLEMQTNSPGTGLGTNWVRIPGSGSATSHSATIDSAAGSVFYRLVYP